MTEVSRDYYANGKLCWEVEIDSHYIINGFCRYYYDNGDLSWECYYMNGVREGEIIEHELGRIIGLLA